MLDHWLYVQVSMAIMKRRARNNASKKYEDVAKPKVMENMRVGRGFVDNLAALTQSPCRN